MLNGFDIGNDLANANNEGYYDGYRDALLEIENQIEQLPTIKYSKWRIRDIIREEIIRFEKLGR